MDTSVQHAARQARDQAAYRAYLRELFAVLVDWAVDTLGCAEPRAIEWAAVQVYEPEGRRLMRRIATANDGNPF